MSIIFVICSLVSSSAGDFVWYDGTSAISYCISGKTSPVVDIALNLFKSDLESVTGKTPVAARTGAKIRIVQYDKASKKEQKALEKNHKKLQDFANRSDAFFITVDGNALLVVGSNGRGTAYGLLELSRMAGVSPWVWWGDIVPEKRNRLTIDEHFEALQVPSVEYRGIFINDEDWTLRPWSYGTYEPNAFGTIGARTYKRVFELLLRLRANAIWPAMHTGTKAFFNTPGAKAMADSCGIAIGTSHCEPLLRNNLDEWNVEKRGAYNYITNRQAVLDYWTERLKEVKGSEGGNMFTIGMRGIHDGSMEGVKTLQEKFDGLQNVINDQQTLIKKYIGNPADQMQVFVPYKEVLELYEKGLQVPDYVTLMWCDDNYGYMTRLSNAQEQQRAGGGGVYYHLSYWGRPHDYLWLATTQPGLIFNEMRAAYDHNVRKLWIVNVHDPKVAGYGLELFLDMAWNINCVSAATVGDHYKAWLCRQFGQEAGQRLYPAMHEFYRLCGQRKPEFMGWSQVELDKEYYARGLSPVANTEFTDEFNGETNRYLAHYAEVSKTVREVEAIIRPELKDAYFAAIEYPVLCADAQARKMLEAQRARQIANGSTRDDMFRNQQQLYVSTAKSQQAYQEIRSLTEYYNERMAGGKWRRSMNMRPRDLPSTAAPALPTQLTDKEVDRILSKNNAANNSATVAEQQGNTTKQLADNAKPNNTQLSDSFTDCIVRNADSYRQGTTGATVVSMLGHSMKAVALPKGEALTYDFTTDSTGNAVLRLALIPTQPNDNGDLRFSVSVDGNEPTVFSLKEPFRSEQWKRNVLRGQALRELPLDQLKAGSHTLTIKAIDSHIIVDQWMVDYKTNRKFYLFPIE